MPTGRYGPSGVRARCYGFGTSGLAAIGKYLGNNSPSGFISRKSSPSGFIHYVFQLQRQYPI